jgi:hypothetical protein
MNHRPRKPINYFSGYDIHGGMYIPMNNCRPPRLNNRWSVWNGVVKDCGPLLCGGGGGPHPGSRILGERGNFWKSVSHGPRNRYFLGLSQAFSLSGPKEMKNGKTTRGGVIYVIMGSRTVRDHLVTLGKSLYFDCLVF